MRKSIVVTLLVLVLVALAGFGHAEPAKIRILHVNDFHGFAAPSEPAGTNQPLGGIAWLAGEAERLRKEIPTLFLAAGDMIQGNCWANFFQGSSVIELMNLMRFDAMVVGNHEFDFGLDVLR
ncbi:MAG TPA: metallophosphoesterase, partial [Geobacteraceae bacterium]|nr:metallophosphoesterase [Geobacteraceae bacterium]